MLKRNNINVRFCLSVIGLAVETSALSALLDPVFMVESGFTAPIDNSAPKALAAVTFLLLVGLGFIIISLSNRFWARKKQ